MSIDRDIATFNLEPIAFKACVDEGWSIAEVDANEAKYRQWLQLIRDHPEKLIAPTRAVDIFWHHHILDTQKYMQDCKKLFGRYIHHFPYSGVRSEEDAALQAARFERTQALLQAVDKP